MSTRTERIFAAFQGPVLSVGTSVVHMFRSYTAELLLPRRWRLALSLGTADVLAALQHATVRAEAARTSPPLRCEHCGDVLLLSRLRVYTRDLPDDLESYCATMRSNCTSSRRHLHAGALLLAVEVRDRLVCSEQFCVFARRPGRQRKCKSDGLVVACSPGDCDGCAVDAPESVPPSPLPPRLVVVVEVWRPTRIDGLPPEAAQLVPGVAGALARVPGFVLQKSSVSADLAIFVRAYRTPEDAARGLEVCAQYTRNVIPNAINRSVEGSAVLLARISNVS
eukprot:m51a1_g8500 hypothetical protein (280) ;mRNA; r:50306-51295